MRLTPALLIAYIICLFLVGCHKNKDIRAEIVSMKSTKVTIDKDSMLYINGDSNLIKEQTLQFTLIVYVDSTECTSCSIGKLKMWESYLSKFNGKMPFQFIALLEVKSGEVNQIERDIANIMLKVPILIDSNFVFRHQNPKFSNNSMFHTFLLNESDSVVLVGNPLQNEHIDKMFRKIIGRGVGDTIRNNQN